MIPKSKYISPQYYETSCVCCGKFQFAPAEYIICNECEQTEAPARRIIELEKKLLEISLTCNAELFDVEDVPDDQLQEPYGVFRAIERDIDKLLNK